MARSARCARYDLPLIFTMIAPSTIRSRNAIASGGSPRYSPHASKSMFVTSDRRAARAPRVDQLVQQARRLLRFTPFDPVEPELVEDQQVEPRSTRGAAAAASGPPARPSGRRAPGAGRVPHPVTQHTGTLADRLDRYGFSPLRSGPTTTRFCRRPMNSAVASVSICTRSMVAALNCQSKSASVWLVAEPGLADAVGDAPLAAAVGLLADQHAAGIPGATAPRARRGPARRRAARAAAGCAAPGSPQGSAGAVPPVSVPVGEVVRFVIMGRLRVTEVLVIRRRPGRDRLLVQPGRELPAFVLGQRSPERFWVVPGPRGCVPRPRANTRRTARPVPARRSGPVGRTSPTAPAPVAPGPCRNAGSRSRPSRNRTARSSQVREPFLAAGPAAGARPRRAGAPCERFVARWRCAAAARAERSPRRRDS